MARIARLKARNKANEIITKYQVERPPVAIEVITEGEGATLVFSSSLEKENISGMLYREGDRSIIAINKTNSSQRKRFTIAHELGHFLLHQNESFVDRANKVNFRNSRSGLAVDPEEIEANTFAAVVLMPKEMLKNSVVEILQVNPSEMLEDLVAELAAIYEVSEQAMEYRLKNLGIINADFEF